MQLKAKASSFGKHKVEFNENVCSCPLNVGVQQMKEEEPWATLLKNTRLVKVEPTDGAES
jgi:hypothetical protein